MPKKIRLYTDDLFILEYLSNEQAGLLLKAILSYTPGQPIALDDITKIVFAPIRFKIDRDAALMDLKSKPTKVYFIQLSNARESFIKIGISHNTKQRYKCYERIGYTVNEIRIEHHQDKDYAEMREWDLHKQFVFHKYVPEIKFAGCTECFNVAIKSMI